jgi:hypothetical protein
VEAKFGSIGDSMVYEQYPHRWTFLNSGTTLRLKDFSPTMASGFGNVRTREDMIKIKEASSLILMPSKTDLYCHAKQILAHTAKKLSRGEDTFNLIETSARIGPEISQAL